MSASSSKDGVRFTVIKANQDSQEDKEQTNHAATGSEGEDK